MRWVSSADGKILQLNNTHGMFFEERVINPSEGTCEYPHRVVV